MYDVYKISKMSGREALQGTRATKIKIGGGDKKMEKLEPSFVLSVCFTAAGLHHLPPNQVEVHAINRATSEICDF